MTMKARSILTCVLLFGMAALGAVDNAAAGAILSPTSGVINSGDPGFGSLDDTFNHNGLLTPFVSSVTDFDTYLAGNPIHLFPFIGNEWFSNNGIYESDQKRQELAEALFKERSHRRMADVEVALEEIHRTYLSDQQFELGSTG